MKLTKQNVSCGLIHALLRSRHAYDRCSFFLEAYAWRHAIATFHQCHADNMLDACVKQVATQCRKVSKGALTCLHACLLAFGHLYRRYRPDRYTENAGGGGGGVCWLMIVNAKLNKSSCTISGPSQI